MRCTSSASFHFNCCSLCSAARHRHNCNRVSEIKWKKSSNPAFIYHLKLHLWIFFKLSSSLSSTTKIKLIIIFLVRFVALVNGLVFFSIFLCVRTLHTHSPASDLWSSTRRNVRNMKDWVSLKCEKWNH